MPPLVLTDAYVSAGMGGAGMGVGGQRGVARESPPSPWRIASQVVDLLGECASWVVCAMRTLSVLRDMFDSRV